MELAQRLRYTYDDYRRWQGDWELIDGFPVAMAPGPFGVHQFIAGLLYERLKVALAECPIIGPNCYLYPELDWIVDDYTVVRPDLSLICKKVLEHNTTPPRLIAEIVSPASRQIDEQVKFELYAKEGVPLYILVLPHLQKVRVFALRDGVYEKVDEGSEKVIFDIDGCVVELDVRSFWEILR